MGIDGLRNDQAFSFLDDQLLIGGLRPDTIDRPGRPADHNGIDEAGRAQTEMKSRITGRFKT